MGVARVGARYLGTTGDPHAFRACSLSGRLRMLALCERRLNILSSNVTSSLGQRMLLCLGRHLSNPWVSVTTQYRIPSALHRLVSV